MNGRRGTIPAILIGLTLAASACTSGSPSQRSALPAGSGGTLRALMTQTGGSPYADSSPNAFEHGAYDPQVASQTADVGLARCCVFRTLMSYSGRPTNEGGAIARPDLASGEPAVSSDGLTWTFRIRPGIHYAPPLANTAVVAEDFIRGLERMFRPTPPELVKVLQTQGPFGSWAYLFLNPPVIQGLQEFIDGKASAISGLEAPDPHTLRVRLTQPSGDLSYLLALPSTAPIPAKPGDPSAALGVAEGHDLDYGKGFAVGTGPYMVEGSAALDLSLPPGEQQAATGAAEDSYTLVRNPSWDPSTDPLRMAYPDRIVISGASDVEKGEAAVHDGTADLVLDWPAPPDLVERYQSSPELRDRVYVDALDASTELSLNLAARPLDDQHVRNAVNLAIDKEALIPILLRDFNTLSSAKTHIGLDSEEGNLLANYAPYGTGSGDPATAQEEMAKSKYDTNADGVCDGASCRGIGIVVPDDDQSRLDMAASIKADLAPLGLEISVDPVNRDDYFASFTDHTQHVSMVLVTYSKDLPSASDFFSSLFSSTVLTSGGDASLLGATGAQLKKWGYSVRAVPNVDDRMRACAEQVFQAQLTCWANFDQFLMEQVVPWVPLLSWSGGQVVSARVASYSFDQSTPFPSAALDRVRLVPAPEAGTSSST